MSKRTKSASDNAPKKPKPEKRMYEKHRCVCFKDTQDACTSRDYLMKKLREERKCECLDNVEMIGDFCTDESKSKYRKNEGLSAVWDPVYALPEYARSPPLAIKKRLTLKTPEQLKRDVGKNRFLNLSYSKK